MTAAITAADVLLALLVGAAFTSSFPDEAHADVVAFVEALPADYYARAWHVLATTATPWSRAPRRDAALLRLIHPDTRA